MTGRDLGKVEWRKSSHSGSTGGECVEVAQLRAGGAVRDSKDPGGGFLVLKGDEWAALLAQIKQGSYDF